jgi:LuxR family quorum-sensing system transcriptional regulator CciR
MRYEFDFKAALARLLQVREESQLHYELERAARDLGFTQFAMGHHVDLLAPADDVIRLTNYDPAWVSQSLGEGYFADDPVHRASMKTAGGFLWSDIPDMVKLTPRQLKILGAARSYGLHEGYTIPVHVPGEYRGTCSFGAESLDRLRPNALPLANMTGIWAFEAARRILRARRRVPAEPQEVPNLTGRQRDSLVLVARGKADSEIGVLLGISSATAHEHVENVRRAYGHAQRPYLIARALFDGQISFGEIFRR